MKRRNVTVRILSYICVVVTAVILCGASAPVSAAAAGGPVPVAQSIDMDSEALEGPLALPQGGATRPAPADAVQNPQSGVSSAAPWMALVALVALWLALLLTGRCKLKQKQ